jgi:hypothetical protein
VAPEDWRERIRRLPDIGWSRQNKDREGSASWPTLSCRIDKARAATEAYIKSKLGLSLTESQMRALPTSQTEAAE